MSALSPGTAFCRHEVPVSAEEIEIISMDDDLVVVSGHIYTSGSGCVSDAPHPIYVYGLLLILLLADVGWDLPWLTGVSR